MNTLRALGFALGGLTASLATTPAALAWPSCSHSAGTGDISPRSEAVLQRAIREHQVLRHDFATDVWNRQKDSVGVERRSDHGDDATTRIREGLVLPEQPRWRM
jgi:hypothetical protein